MPQAIAVHQSLALAIAARRIRNAQAIIVMKAFVTKPERASGLVALVLATAIAQRTTAFLVFAIEPASVMRSLRMAQGVHQMTSVPPTTVMRARSAGSQAQNRRQARSEMVTPVQRTISAQAATVMRAKFVARQIGVVLQNSTSVIRVRLVLSAPAHTAITTSARFRGAVVCQRPMRTKNTAVRC